MSGYTFHTVLMRKIASNGAEFVIGHPAIVGKTSSFVNAIFAKFTSGEFVEVKFRISGEKRYILGAVSATSQIVEVANLDLKAKAQMWVSKRFGTLVREHKSFATSSGIKTFALSNGDNYRSIGKHFRMTYSEGTTPEVAMFVTEGGDIIKPSAENSSTEHAEAVVVEAPIEKPRTSIFSDTRLSMSSLGAVSEKNGMFVKRGDWALFEGVFAIAEESAANVLMVGPSGTGKTSLPTAFAKEKKMQIFKMDCATIRDPEEWFGYREAIDGTTTFVKSAFVKAVEQGNTLIILDEFNRVEPWLHNSLYALLDHSRKTQIHGEHVSVAKGTIFVATANLGSAFTGTFTLDAALTNRFDATIFTSFLDARSETKLIIERIGLDEESAGVIISVMGRLRSLEATGLELPVDISTRTSLKIANLVMKSQLPFKKILDYAIISLIDEESTKKSIMDAIASLLP